jgi:hypothetical protein
LRGLHYIETTWTTNAIAEQRERALNLDLSCLTHLERFAIQLLRFGIVAKPEGFLAQKRNFLTQMLRRFFSVTVVMRSPKFSRCLSKFDAQLVRPGPVLGSAPNHAPMRLDARLAIPDADVRSRRQIYG